MISLTEIQDVHNSCWKPGYGSISAKEAMFLQEGIYGHRPCKFLEIGTASGLSTGFIAKFLDSSEIDAELFTLDLSTTFWGEEGKKTGFLAEEICSSSRVKIDYILNEDSTFIRDRFSEQEIEMAFIDANHQHPWPTLDMLAVLPFMKPGSLIYHHDLALYKKQVPIFGIGPKYLFDQLPHELRTVTSENEQNIYYVVTPRNYLQLSVSLLNSLYLPWTIRRKIPDDTLSKFKSITKRYWSEGLADALAYTAEKYNK